ncbi:MAG TPA: acyl carrier protein [Opitutaceae bacterium]|nr:acyl carrier protein [Opitutaceae bacterium]
MNSVTERIYFSPTTSAPAHITFDQPFGAADEANLRDALKRCTPAAIDAALSFRRTGEMRYVPAAVVGIIERYVEREHRWKLRTREDEIRLVEDLSIDSLTMMEIVLLTEEVLLITIDNDELRDLRTLGDVHRFIEQKIGSGKAAPGS